MKTAVLQEARQKKVHVIDLNFKRRAMTEELKPCPFCGMQSDVDDEDTLYPSGTGWREDPFGTEVVLRHYLSRTDWYRWQGTCYEINCSTNYGGCGANISGDSKEEVINKWNQRY